MPWIYVGKTGTGKTTKALECLPPNPIIRYANEYDIEDNFSIPKDRGILIEEAHYKPNVDLIIKTILEYKGTIVLTSINQKDVPKKLYDMCKLKRAGTINHAQIKLKESGCINTEDIDSGLEKNIFEMINIYLRSKDRDKVAEMLNVQDNIFYSRDRIDFDHMNILYNISDFCINTSYAEGFGLSTLESMMTGTPIIAPKTGGLTRQVVDYRDATENGVALDIVTKTLVGSQSVPYIYEDYSSCDDAAEAMLKICNMSEEENKKLSDKVLKYALEEFSLQKTIDMWHETMLKTMKDFKKNLGKGNNFTVNEY